MSNQDAIGLTSTQRSAIQTAMKDAQGSFVDTQFKLSSEMEKLKALVGSTPTDEAKVLEEIDRVLALER
jgi:Spy/CpxP family protein refolding chaperone